jgi:U3 small nucleolar ribonucleoprotein component
MIAIANDNVIQAREFWNAKVNKIIQNFEYGRITMESLVDELALMGYEKEQVWALIAEDEDY